MSPIKSATDVTEAAGACGEQRALAVLSAVGASALAASLVWIWKGGLTLVSAAACLGVAVAGAVGYLLVRRHARAIDEAIRLRAQQGSADRAAYIDSLTTLPNRLAFRQHLEAALARSPREPVVVLFADLDRFKEVNDGLGHDAGDALLVEVARRFRAAMGPNDLLARLGGDEFAAVLCGEDASQRIDAIAETVVETVQETIVVKGNAVSVGVSIGVAGGDEEDLASEELLRRADIAMYRAKADSARSYHRFSHEMDETLILRRSMKTELEAATRNGQIRLDLQPVFSARTGKVVSAEALMRWRHPERGELSPAKFIALAEESGQIAELGDWAIDRALDYILELGLPIAVNVSPAQFRHHAFAKTVADKLVRMQAPPELLKIEITEGVLITHTDAAKRTIRQLRDLGVKVVLDDFGTGYSSLSYLQSFEFDAVKIDRSFVRDLGSRHQSTQLARAIVDMGHGLGMEVVAEGIENARQASLLQILGCDQLQGFFLGVPGTIDALKAKMASAGHGNDAMPEAKSA
jgi:diguanylate cyclase (GGDEF)-like protein